MSDFTRHRRWHLSETVCSAEALERPNDVTWMQKKKKKKKKNACSCNTVNLEFLQNNMKSRVQHWKSLARLNWNKSFRIRPPQKSRLFFLLLSSNFSSRFTAGFRSADCRRKSLHVSSSRRLQMGPAQLWWMFRLTACHCRTEWKFSFWSERIWLHNLDYFGLTLGEYSLFFFNFYTYSFFPPSGLT